MKPISNGTYDTSPIGMSAVCRDEFLTEILLKKLFPRVRIFGIPFYSNLQKDTKIYEFGTVMSDILRFWVF